MVNSKFSASTARATVLAITLYFSCFPGASAQAAVDKPLATPPSPMVAGSSLSNAESRRIRIEKALHFVNHLTRSTFDPSSLSDDFTIWTASAGHFKRDKYLENLSTARSIWKEPLEFSISLALERQNCVVIEATSSGILFTGDHYGNEYLFVIEFDADNRIRHVREHYDPQKIETIYRPAALKWKAAQTQ